MSNYAVILAGGKGERFWPLSTARFPKQLLSLVGDRPMLAQAVQRLDGLIPPARVFVITNQDLVAATCQAVPELPRENVIGEPVGRDTAAAVALGAALVKARDPRGVFCILTADHVIGDLDLFRGTLRESMARASGEDVLITIGIKPTAPATGYGYIDAREAAGESHGICFFQAERFVEKPVLQQAREYLASGHYFWNSGMFIWSVASIQSAFRVHRPPLDGLIDRMARDAFTERFAAALAKEFAALEKISIDYAVMEKARNIVMARGVFAWDDVGSWTALENHFPKDADGNLCIGDVQEVDSAHNIVFSRDRMTALVGVKDVIVVQAEGVTLVCARDKAQEVKKLVEKLRKHGGYQGVL